MILRLHDDRPDKGVPFGDTLAHTLGYADAAALTEVNDDVGLIRIAERLDVIATGSRDSADMDINKDKTKMMFVKKQDPISKTKSEEAEKLCKFTCPHM